MGAAIRHWTNSSYDDLEPIIAPYLHQLSLGVGVLVACKVVGVAKKTIIGWRREFPDFAHKEQMVRDRVYVRLRRNDLRYGLLCND